MLGGVGMESGVALPFVLMLLPLEIRCLMPFKPSPSDLELLRLFVDLCPGDIGGGRSGEEGGRASSLDGPPLLLSLSREGT